MHRLCAIAAAAAAAACAPPAKSSVKGAWDSLSIRRECKMCTVSVLLPLLLLLLVRLLQKQCEKEHETLCQ